VPGDVALWPQLTGGETLDLLGRLRGAPAPRRAELLERFELDPTRKVGTYSTGNRQKVALVAALSADVDLLVLDEPTRGLDPLMEEVFRQCVREARDAGRAVLLSSHLLDEVEALCDSVTIVRGGRTVESGTLEQLRHLTALTVTARLTDDPRALADLPGVADLAVDDEVVTFALDRTRLTEVLPRLAGLGLTDLAVAPPSLEQLFLRHYAGGAA
jgi:ABC-2 type transport system ATP-binding protein